MKRTSLITALFSFLALGAAEAPDAMLNGGFETPGTVVTGWARKQHWVGWGMIHGKCARGKEILALLKRTVTDKNPASGKYAAALISPKETLSVTAPTPSFSSKISQTCKIPVSAKSAQWLLKFKMRGTVIPSKPSGGFNVFVTPLKADPKKPGKFVDNGKGLQKLVPVKPQWQENTVTVDVPAGTSQVYIVLAFYQAGEIYLDDVSFRRK